MRFSFQSGRVPLSAGDWLILAGLGIIATVIGYWFLASVSLRATTLVPARGGTLTEGIVGTPRFINPVLAISDSDRDMTRLVFSGLMRTGPDGTLVPDLAERYSISEDGKAYTFTIHRDALFHDGTPVTAEAVQYTINLIQDPAVKSPKRANWEGVVVTVDDPQTITFTLKEPYAPFLQNTDLGILPKHLWKDVRAEELPFSKLNVEPVGAGPYRVEKLTTTSAGIPSALSLVQFSKARTRAYISRLIFTFYPDTTALETAVIKNGALGAHSITPPAGTGQTVHEAILGRVFSVFFNQNQNNLFASKAVRQALDAALDKNQIVGTLIGGYGSPAAGPLPQDSIVEVPDDTSLDSARAIIEKDGWKLGDDGVYAKTVKKSTTRLAFTLTTGTAPELKRAGELVAEAWRAFGADVTVQYFDQADLQQNVIRPRKYDALLFGQVIGREADLFAFWDSSQRNDPGLNIALYTNSSVDTWLREARTTDDPKKSAELIQKIVRMITDEAAAIFLYTPHFVYLTDPRLQGVTLGTIVTPADRFNTIPFWYLETERVWPFFN